MRVHHKTGLTTILSATKNLFVNKSFFISRIPLLVCSMMLITANVHAQQPPLATLSGFLEVGALHSRLSENNPQAGIKCTYCQDWNDQYLRGNWQISPAGRINGEISNQRHFGDQGVFVGAGYTHVFNETWYGSLSAGTSEGGFFLPRKRVDGSISRKWLEKKNLISNIGLGYYQAKEIYSDRSLLLSALYYFDAPLIIEAGARMNESNPGGIRSNRGFAVLTYGKNKQHYLTLRYEKGNEAYQLVEASTAISDFSSNEISLIWRQWLSKDFGFNVLANHYNNPNYTRSGIQVGIFRDF